MVVVQTYYHQTRSDGSVQPPNRTTMASTPNTLAMTLSPAIRDHRNKRFALLAATPTPGDVDTTFFLSSGKLLQQARTSGTMVHRSESTVRKATKLPLVGIYELSYNNNGVERPVLRTSVGGQDIGERLKDDITLLDVEETMADLLDIQDKTCPALRLFFERNGGRPEESRKSRGRKGGSNASAATRANWRSGDDRRRLADVLLVTYKPGVYHPVRGIGWVDEERLPFELFLRARANEKVAAAHWSGLPSSLAIGNWDLLLEVVDSKKLAGELNNNPTSPATQMFLTAYNTGVTAVRSLESRVQLEVLKTTLATALSTAEGVGHVAHSVAVSSKDLQTLDWEETTRSQRYNTTVRFVSPGAGVTPKSAFYATPKSAWPLLKMAMQAVACVLNTCGMFNRKKTVEIRGIVIGICKYMLCHAIL